MMKIYDFCIYLEKHLYPIYLNLSAQFISYLVI
jgi:hypothetical protein